MEYYHPELKEGALTLCIHFSSRNKMPGQYDKFPTTKNVSNIYINPGRNNWYLNGFLNPSESLSSSVDLLCSIIEKSGCKKVVCIGSSMGAYGAAFFAPLIKATRAILFNPDLCLSSLFSYAKQNLTSSDLQLLPSIKAQAGCDYYVIAGMHSPQDVFSTIHFFSGDIDTYYFLPNCGHSTSRFLNQFNLLNRVIEDLLLDTPKCEMLNVLSYPMRERLSYFFKDNNFNHQTILNYVQTFMHVNKPKSFVEGVVEDLMSKRLFGNALSLLGVFAQSNPLSSDMKLKLARCARKTKQYSLALKITQELINTRLNKEALWESALALESMNQIEKSRDVMAKIYRLHLEDPIYKIAYSKCSKPD